MRHFIIIRVYDVRSYYTYYSTDAESTKQALDKLVEHMDYEPFTNPPELVGKVTNNWSSSSLDVWVGVDETEVLAEAMKYELGAEATNF